MKRLACALALTALAPVLASAVLGADAPSAAAPEAIPIPKAERPLVIDGVLYEPVWREARPLRVDYADDQPGTLTEPPKMTVRLAWDDQYLYIGYEAFDTNLVAKGGGDIQGPPNNKRENAEASPVGEADFVEFFISFSDSNFFWEIHHNPANQFSDIWCTVVDPKWPLAQSSMHRWGILFGHEMHIHDQGAYTVAMAVRPTLTADRTRSTVNKTDDEDAGYTAEIRLPWGGIGAPRPLATDVPIDPADPYTTIPGPWKMAGRELVLLAVVHNGDINKHYFHSSPTRKGGWFHMSYEHWPRYTFVEDAADSPAQ